MARARFLTVYDLPRRFKSNFIFLSLKNFILRNLIPCSLASCVLSLTVSLMMLFLLRISVLLLFLRFNKVSIQARLEKYAALHEAESCLRSKTLNPVSFNYYRLFFIFPMQPDSLFRSSSSCGGWKWQ